METTLRSWLPDEPIEAIKFYDHRLFSGGTRWDLVPFNQVLPIDDPRVQHTLDVEFDSGFGGQDCPHVYLWTATRVGFIHEYDGSTRMRLVYRNPT